MIIIIITVNNDVLLCEAYLTLFWTSIIFSK